MLVNKLAYWITEREKMRLRKEQFDGEDFRYGFSDDPHMGTVRYCNVRREDDKVTKWLAEHWRPNYSEPWGFVAMRMINYIPSLDVATRAIRSQFTVDPIAEMITAMKARRSTGEKVFTSAYTISTCGAKMDKLDYVEGVLRAVQKQTTYPGTPIVHTLDNWHRWLQGVNGLGSFLAAQVVADMKNTEWHPLRHAIDWHGWSAWGPGSLKGLSVFFNENVTPSQYHVKLSLAWRTVKPLVPNDLHDLHMQDFQNCMCEFSKYMRVQVGGHVRNKYRPGND